MSNLDILYLVLTICAVIITGVIVYVAKDLVTTLRRLDSVLADVEATTHDINTIREGVKTGFLSLASSLIDNLQKNKGGDINE